MTPTFLRTVSLNDYSNDKTRDSWKNQKQKEKKTEDRQEHFTSSQYWFFHPYRRFSQVETNVWYILYFLSNIEKGPDCCHPEYKHFTGALSRYGRLRSSGFPRPGRCHRRLHSRVGGHLRWSHIVPRLLLCVRRRRYCRPSPHRSCRWTLYPSSWGSRCRCPPLWRSHGYRWRHRLRRMSRPFPPTTWLPKPTFQLVIAPACSLAVNTPMPTASVFALNFSAMALFVELMFAEVWALKPIYLQCFRRPASGLRMSREESPWLRVR